MQCQLNVCEFDLCYFIVWSPNELICIEITRDQSFFEQYLSTINNFITKAILPEDIGQYFMRKPQKIKKQPLSESYSTNVATTSDDISHYCICKRPDDGSIMICCDNDNWTNGQWFHLECMKMSKEKVPKGAWMCPQCRSN